MQYRQYAMGKTQERKSEEGQSEARKCRGSGSETVEQDMDFQKQEFELRKREQEQMVEAQN